MAPWLTFYTLTGGAAATLIGLMFIAVTFGSKLVTAETVHLARSILSPIFYHFAHAFLIACVAVLPESGFEALAAVALITSLGRLFMVPGLIRQMKIAHETNGDMEASDWILNVGLPVLLYLSLASSGVACWKTESWGAYGVAASVMALLILGTVNAWDMLIWMASKVE